MSATKLAIIGIVMALIWFVFLNEKHDPINFSGEVYEYVETTNVNVVKNIFYTPNGVNLDGSPKAIQIVNARHPNITEAKLQLLRRQLSETMALKAIDGYTNRYFGIFKNRDLMYALEKNNVFIIYVVIRGFSSDESTLREEAHQVIDALDNISISHLN